jgi:methyltransferase (TIGR00027 family)
MKTKPSDTAVKVALNIIALQHVAEVQDVMPEGLVDDTMKLLTNTEDNNKRHIKSHCKPGIVKIYKFFDKLVPGQFYAFAARKAFFENETERAIKDGANQVLVLGAGFDLLCYRLSKKYPEVEFFEIDEPLTMNSKIKGLNSMDRKFNHHTIASDLSEENLDDVLSNNNNWDSSKKTMVIGEGLLMYLPEQSAIELFSRVNQVVGNDSLFAYTFIDKADYGPDKLNWKKKFLLWSLRKRNEPWLWIPSFQELENVIKNAGWEVLLEPFKSGIEHLSIARKKECCKNSRGKMNIEFRYLTDVPIDEVQQCMQESFADYQLDMSYMTIEAMKHRNAICRNDPTCSVGAFDGNKMVGYLNVGVDYFNGDLTAFDGGTGVIKDYRGQGIAGKMLSKSVEELKRREIKKFMLEVLQPNTAAIRAYEKEGFTIARNLKCYEIAIEYYKGTTKEIAGVEIINISVNELEKYWSFIEHPISWEHMLTGLKAVADELIIMAAYNENQCIGFIVYTPALCWVTAIGLAPQHKYYAELVDCLISNLFKDIDPIRPKVSVNNLEEDDILNPILIELGFENPVDQFEMIKEL